MNRCFSSLEMRRDVVVAAARDRSIRYSVDSMYKTKAEIIGRNNCGLLGLNSWRQQSKRM